MFIFSLEEGENNIQMYLNDTVIAVITSEPNQNRCYYTL